MTLYDHETNWPDMSAILIAILIQAKGTAKELAKRITFTVFYCNYMINETPKSAGFDKKRFRYFLGRFRFIRTLGCQFFFVCLLWYNPDTNL